MRYAVLAVLLLSGCSATMVASRGNSASAFAPTNEKTSRGGTVKYLNQGYSGVRAARREDAYKKMFANCSGPYKIVSEGARSEGGAVVPIGGVGFVEDSQYWYITFACE